jgi:hypothetical protein
MDFADMCRCLPFVAVLKPEAYAKPAIAAVPQSPAVAPVAANATSVPAL